MAIAGDNLKSANPRLRFLGIIFLSVIAFAAILYWRHYEFLAQEYVEFPQHDTQPIANKSFLKSKNYQIETIDTSPSVK